MAFIAYARARAYAALGERPRARELGQQAVDAYKRGTLSASANGVLAWLATLREYPVVGLLQ